jgi:hypothetical protein
MGLTPLIWVAVAIAIFLILKRKKKKKPKPGEKRRSEVDAWVGDVLKESLAKKTQLPSQALEETFAGDPDAAAVSAIEHALKDVKLKCERLSGGEIECKVEVRFEDGETIERTKRFGESGLPDASREELRRTGASFTFSSWEPPWRS